MSYDYMFLRPTRRLVSHEEIDEAGIIPFTSNEDILALSRKVYPDAVVDAEGFGYLDPVRHRGSIHLSDDGFFVFYLAHLSPEEVQVLCTRLGLAAFDGQKMELIQAE